MIAERETCTACGVPLHEKLPGLETVCPACVVRAAQTPTTIKDGSEGTTWAQVFPQLEIESCLRDDPEAPVYLARVLGDGASERAVLQLASGSVLTRAGGTATLLARSQRLAGSDLEGVAEVLDFGDLADAFSWSRRHRTGRPFRKQSANGRRRRSRPSWRSSRRRRRIP